MLGQHILEERTRIRGQHLIIMEAAHSHDFVHQGLCHDIDFTIFRFYQNVGLPGVEADAHIAGQGPDGGGPDDEVGPA